MMKESKIEAPQNGIQKFISLMKSLTEFIQQDFSHQMTIYEYLNSEQIKRLFESIHESQTQLRITSIKFISYLLHNNAKIIQLICILMGYPFGSDNKKFIIGGLNHYVLNGCDLRSIVLAIKKVKYQPGLIAWAIDLKQYQAHNLNFHLILSIILWEFSSNHKRISEDKKIKKILTQIEENIRLVKKKNDNTILYHFDKKI